MTVIGVTHRVNGSYWTKQTTAPTFFVEGSAPPLGMNAGLKAFVAAVLGGIGNLQGAALGGLVIGVVEALVVGYGNPTYRDPIVFGALILILGILPGGLMTLCAQAIVATLAT